MKAQKFYPRQVLRKLQGDHHDLTRGQLAAIRYATLNGRRLGMNVWVYAAIDIAPFTGAGASHLAAAAVANATTRIEVKEHQRQH